MNSEKDKKEEPVVARFCVQCDYPMRVAYFDFCSIGCAMDYMAEHEKAA
mgnify:CR=1 FL=1